MRLRSVLLGIGSLLAGNLLLTGSLWAASPASSAVQLNADLSTPWVMPGEKKRLFVKVGLVGTKPVKSRERGPVNIALVLDRSSSMSGVKIRRAREAAIMAIDQLDAQDVVSVVVYSDSVEVVVPATRVGDGVDIKKRIAQVQSGGMTALFAGVSKAAAEVRKFARANQVNRVVLLSDGMANVGPSSVGELADLGRSLAKEGIAVTTFGLGLGYNEDLMMRLANASDGNHMFIEDAEQLASVFRSEFGDAFAVVAVDVDISIEFMPGATPLRGLGREVAIRGQKVQARLNQLSVKREKYVMIEVEIDPVQAGEQRQVAVVRSSFVGAHQTSRSQLHKKLQVRGARSPSEVERHTHRRVMIEAVRLIASAQSEVALALRDKGEVEKARALLLDNAGFLGRNAKRYRSKSLDRAKARNRKDSESLDDNDWGSTRKAMRNEQLREQKQMTY